MPSSQDVSVWTPLFAYSSALQAKNQSKLLVSANHRGELLGRILCMRNSEAASAITGLASTL
ncbi:hypothetical protein [Variovorax sp. Varisp62]|uniref:hypothetical protein n=1 Tax=Variovorax sp. Varisp62 TaxID=3243049 RepID=UPI0039B63158